MSMQHEAALITELFRQRNIRCRITGGYATPSYLCFRMEKDLAQDHKPLVGLANDIEAHLHAYRARSGNLPANAQTSVRITLKPLAIEVNRPQPDALPFDAAMQRWPGEAHTALCGWTFDNGPKGEPLIWNLADPATAHAFVAGTTGSGKSNLLLAILKSLAWSTSPADPACTSSTVAPPTSCTWPTCRTPSPSPATSPAPRNSLTRSPPSSTPARTAPPWPAASSSSSTSSPRSPSPATPSASSSPLP